MKIKKTLLALGLAALFTTPGPVQGGACDPCYDPCYDPCNTCCDTCFDFDCNWCEGWSVYGDYLWMATRKNNLDFVVPTTTTPTAIGGVAEVCPGYDSGFRVGIQKECDDVYFSGSYTWYQPRAHNQINGTAGQLAGTWNVEGFGNVENSEIVAARAAYKNDYNDFNLLIGYNYCISKCISGTFFGGFKGVVMRQNFDILYSATNDFSTDLDFIYLRNKLDAYGSEVGGGLTFKIFQCLDFFGNASLDVLVGKNQRDFRIDTSTDGGATTTEVANLRDDCTKMVGIYNFQFGFTYHLPDCLFRCGCWDLSADLSVGYEFHNWINASDFLKYTNESSEVTIDRSTDTFGMDALFARFAVSF